jgi:hypothetical protein
MQMLGDATAARGPLTNTFVKVRLVRYAFRFLGNSFKDGLEKGTLVLSGGLREADDQVDSRQYLIQYSLTQVDAWRAVYY